MSVDHHLQRLFAIGGVLTTSEFEQCKLRCRHLDITQVRSVVRYVDTAMSQVAMTSAPDLRRRVGRAFFQNIERLHADSMRLGSQG